MIIWQFTLEFRGKFKVQKIAMSKTIEQHNTNFAYRPDIDGLRAIAILLVIIFHAFPKFLRGGFIGVDIFFVISGYLITSIILKNQSQNNFSLLDFYSRRIKRIFPALIVVLTFCLVAGWFIFFGNEYEFLGKHITAGSVYISNFVLQSESGYFDIDSELKPLLHLWSLAIEEQFYVIFPLLLIAGKRFRVNPLLIISMCLSVSFLTNVIQIHDKPTEVFFFPYSRAWELLIGSFVAYLSIHSIGKNQAEKFANPLSWLGVILILSAWIFLDSKKILFPSWWALMPTLGTACLIFSGEKAWFNREILASKIAIFIGLISYPLYLWHWILLSFLKITEVEKLNSWLKISILIISVIFAWLTYHFIEKNLRFQKSKFVSLGLLFNLLLIGSIGYFVTLQKGYPNRYKIEASWLEGELGSDIFKKKGFVAQKSCIKKYQYFFEKQIQGKELLDYEFCLLQDSEKPPTALLLGDSHANHLYAGLVNNISLTGGNLLNLGRGACYPFVDLQFQEEECLQLVTKGLDMAITNPTIGTIILTSRAFKHKDSSIFKEFIGSNLEEDDFYLMVQKGMKKTLEKLISTNKKIIFILDTPKLDFLPEECVARPWRLSGSSFKTPCASSRLETDEARRKYLNVVMPVLKEFPSVRVLDPLPAFCDDTYCWAIKDKKLLYRDSGHLSEVGAIYLGRYFQHYLSNDSK